jgi:HSP20 family molecular chaperone IbpA
MRYRYVSRRYLAVVRSGQSWPFGDIWQSEHVRVLVQGRWQPAADVYETASAVEVVVDLAGVHDEDYEIQLFEDALVIEGHRVLPTSEADAVYHAAAIRQGPFCLELALPALADPDRVEARYERGLLRITLPKRAESA